MLKDPFTGQPSIPFTLYAMECEGVTDNFQGKRNRLIKHLLEMKTYTIVDEDTIRDEFFDIMLYNPTEAEIEDILIEVMR